jgi:N-hydroxyarylamine O-acetyltransferase
MNVDEYLKRINSPNLKEVSVENLRLLQANHLKNVPFENFDIHLGKHIKFSKESAYEKIVKLFRGGYCFELNTLFAWLLEKLGYKVNYIGCYYFSNKTNEYSNLPFHLALIVNLNDTSFYVDVGIAKPMLRFPLRLKNVEIQNQNYEVFRFNSNDNNNEYVLERQNSQRSWIPIVKFILNKTYDFEYLNELVQTDQFPSLYNHTICVRHLDFGLVMLIDFKYTEIYFDDNFIEHRKEMILNLEESLFVLKTKFGLSILNENFDEEKIILKKFI